MKGSADTTSLAAASRLYLQDRTGASAGPDPILLVLADGRIISNSVAEARASHRQHRRQGADQRAGGLLQREP